MFPLTRSTCKRALRVLAASSRQRRCGGDDRLTSSGLTQSRGSSSSGSILLLSNTPCPSPVSHRHRGVFSPSILRKITR
ncbi:unnamed protein product [Pleuronectes platessa]|uniref:Uncharacterized protein n=1 Tax=Pleuronectes platessa TaxID=8262 RepID=A0A9N7TRI4_PLEPL|nr:unnamed protein product [Pleuronectes platessa]